MNKVIKRIKHEFILANNLEVSLKLFGSIITEQIVIDKSDKSQKINVNVPFYEGKLKEKYILWLTKNPINISDIIFQQTIPGINKEEKWNISITKN